MPISLAALSSPSTELELKNLSSLLGRLNRSLLPSAEEGRSATLERYLDSPYDRQRIRANFEYARSLLLRLEHASAGITIASQKQATQVDLRLKRDQIKRLQLRIQDLDQVQTRAEEDGDDSVSEPGPDEHQADQETKQLPSLAQVSSSLPDGHMHLRQRVGKSLPMTSGYTTGRTEAALENQDRPDATQLTREKQLTSDRREQEEIMESLLSLTHQLKSSASTFNSTIQEEKQLLSKAVRGLDGNADAIEAAGMRMSTLRKMTEGKGLWGRLMLYAYIAGLWLLALVIVFVLPKLRF